MSGFKKAERRQAKLKIALSGPSGSGKTYSALALATGIGGRIAVIDTENGSASLYADRFEFDTLQLRPPFEPKKYVEAIKAAVDAGYDVLIIDSLSQVWAGEGGVLDKKAALDQRGGNQYANWKGPKAEHQKFKDAILHSPIHMIATLRSKQGYQIDEQSKKVLKVGMDPIAEPGLEYEYTTVLDIAMDHNAMASKDRTSLFDQAVFKISAETGKQFVAWLNSGAPAEASEDDAKAWENAHRSPAVAPKGDATAEDAKQRLRDASEAARKAGQKPSEKQLKRMFAIATEAQLTSDDMKAYMLKTFGVESSKDLNLTQYDALCGAMEAGKVPQIALEPGARG